MSNLKTCRQCGLRKGDIIIRYPNGITRGICGTERGWIHEKIRNGYTERGALRRLGFIKVSITVVNLNHIKNDRHPNNLKPLCQYCLVQYIAQERMFNRRYGCSARENNYDAFEPPHRETKNNVPLNQSTREK